jgi:hypothetical protein
MFSDKNRQTKSISEVTRRALFDDLMLSGVQWAGRLTETDYLSRIYDLSALPSTDHRFSSAADDIQQHRVSFSDWEDDWVFFDPRFNLLHGTDEALLKFLVQLVHPVVRPDSEEARALVLKINKHIAVDGWSLTQVSEVSERPIFTASNVRARAAAFHEPTGWLKVDRQLQEARERLVGAKTEEQFQAVGLICREVLISVAQAHFEVSKHWKPDEAPPSTTDAGKMLESVFAVELAGGSNEEARAHGKAALKLALALQHHRAAHFRMAALCVEGTASIVNLVAILSGRRG